MKSKQKSNRINQADVFSKLAVPDCNAPVSALPRMKSMDSEALSDYRNEDLVRMKFPGRSVLINAHHPRDCDSFVNPTVGKMRDCLAVVHAHTRVAHQLLRYDSAPKWKGLVTRDGQHMPTGFFRRVGNRKGRARIAEKMGPLFLQLPNVEAVLQGKLQQRGLGRGSDVLVMVVNAGEMDLLLNFACSCRAHNISLHNALVFTGSRCVFCLCYYFIS